MCVFAGHPVVYVVGDHAGTSPWQNTASKFYIYKWIAVKSIWATTFWFDEAISPIWFSHLVQTSLQQHINGLLKMITHLVTLDYICFYGHSCQVALISSWEITRLQIAYLRKDKFMTWYRHKLGSNIIDVGPTLNGCRSFENIFRKMTYLYTVKAPFSTRIPI